MFTVNALIGGTGGLHVPSIPEFEGKDSFKGKAFHSAHWKKDFDPTGRTVAIIGTGATSVQLLPAIADKVTCSLGEILFISWITLPADLKNWDFPKKKKKKIQKQTKNKTKQNNPPPNRFCLIL